jgi:hypothetical protein
METMRSRADIPISKGKSFVYIRIYFSEMPSAMLFRVSVERRDTPERKVTPVKTELLPKDSTVTEISSADMEGTKHSIPAITVKLKSDKNNQFD